MNINGGKFFLSCRSTYLGGTTLYIYSREITIFAENSFDTSLSLVRKGLFTCFKKSTNTTNIFT